MKNWGNVTHRRSPVTDPQETEMHEPLDKELKKKTALKMYRELQENTDE